ncbi:DUF1294 domain-containing protein [Streptococcus catagoni]|uniref:DUF1294 domain-containing protein n=1 Tax=Streptococcus catagoni TaxID=2654874 RepID=UPI00140D7104|nr:DUF1294 domain-containing protein [Streptococcus catagoni]
MLPVLLTCLFLWNVLVFLLYAIDKRKAIKNQWRIPEKILLLATLFYGAVGALLAAKLCHHKTRKWYFQLAWVLGLVILFVSFYFLYRLNFFQG